MRGEGMKQKYAMGKKPTTETKREEKKFDANRTQSHSS